jgi:hypothetical protein
VPFKEFITKQRVAIFFIGLLAFCITLVLSHIIGFNSLWGELFIDLAASAFTIIFTTLIIDYLQLREKGMRTMNAAALAEAEIRTICLRIKWRMARLLGMQQDELDRNAISDRESARNYLDQVTKKVDSYLSAGFEDKKQNINDKALQKYLERLQDSQNELEQTLILYDYALSYSLRECVLALRRELQTSDRLLGFIDNGELLNDANRSLIEISAQSVYDAVEDVLTHSSTSDGEPIHAKTSQFSEN